MGQTLTQTAFDAVMEMIVAGDLPQGAVVSEREIAETLGLSRTPLREALNRLEAQNYLRRHGRTLLVQAVALDDALEILVARRALEAEAARAAAGRMAPDEVASLRAETERMQAAGDATAADHWQLDDRVHVRIAEAAGNRLILRLIRDLRLRTRIFGKDRIPDRFAPGLAEHLAILDAIEAGDGPAAAERMAAHLDHARQAILRAATGG
jgi:DNA-binding GntR family transcriptional regulator